jgi:intracellular sulfur oxidation DsrE/DsrF family protein
MQRGGSDRVRRVTLLVSDDLAWAVQLAQAWSAAGDSVTLVLLDGAAAAARAGHGDAALLARVQARGVSVAAHDDALRRRAIGRDRLATGVKVVDLDEVADLAVAATDKVVWL